MNGTQQVGSIKSVWSIKSVYRYKLWQRCLYGLLGAFFGVGGFAILLNVLIFPRMRHPEFLLAGAMVMAFAAYMLALAFRSRIIIDGTRIQVRGPFGERSADRGDIQGSRAVSSRYGSFRQLVLKDGRSPIPLRPSFKTDDNFRAWLQQFPDLDLRDREALLARIEQQQDLGATSEQRLGALARAKRLNIALMAIAVAAALGFNFAPQAWVRPCAVVLALAPPVAAWLCWRWPLLYTVFRKRRDPRAETSHGLLIAGLGLLFHMGQFHFLSLAPLMAGMALVALVTVAAYYQPALSGYGTRTLLAVFLLSALYAYGTLTMVDACFDSSSGQRYSAAVVGSDVTHGRSTTYYLRLAPWGPVPAVQDVSVSWQLYHTTAPGDTVCLDLHPGRLKAPWFRVAACPVSP